MVTPIWVLLSFPLILLFALLSRRWGNVIGLFSYRRSKRERGRKMMTRAFSLFCFPAARLPCIHTSESYMGIGKGGFYCIVLDSRGDA